MSKSSQSIAIQVAGYYWNRAKKYPFSLVGILCFIPLTILTGFYLPGLVVAGIIRQLSTGDYISSQGWQAFIPEVATYAALIITNGFVMWRIVDVFVWRLEGNVQKDIARDVFRHLSNESADFHANHFSGSLVSQANKLIGSYVRIADTLIYNTLPLFFGLIITSVILAPRSPLYVLVLVSFAIIYVAVALTVSRPVRQRGSEHAAAESKQTGYLADVIGNIMAVKSFAGEQFEQDTFYTVTDHTHSKLKRVMRAHMKQMLYFSGVSRLISTASIMAAVVSVVTFKADVATVFLIINYTSNIVEQLFAFSNNALRNYNRSIGDASDMVKILRTPSEIKDTARPEAPRMNRGKIEFKSVGFTHKNAEEAIFTGLNLRIKPGEKVGLIGPSGSGKTSLTRLLLRFSDINAGSIEIDGQNIAAVTQSDLRRTISYVPQEPILFHRTIAENISYGRQEADLQEVIAIARKANADEFIQTLQHGYDTIVGERGVKLSGGQRQRIAIARAMLKNAPILVLDEATSALDSESEALIQDALWKLMEGRTAIVIAHRLSTIQKMDRIIVLENGAIVEEGSHKDLLFKNGVYAQLWNRQSGGFLEE